MRLHRLVPITNQAAAFWIDFRLRNDLYCVGWGVKLYSLTVDRLEAAHQVVGDGVLQQVARIELTSNEWPGPSLLCQAADQSRHHRNAELDMLPY